MRARVCVLFQENTLGNAINVNVSYTLPSQVTESSANLKKQWAYFAYAMTAFTTILFFVVLWMRKSILIAIAIIKEASSEWELRVVGACLLIPVCVCAVCVPVCACVRVCVCAVALTSMKSLFLYPFVTVLLVAVLMVYWIFVAAYMASAGNDIAQSAAYQSAEVRAGPVCVCVCARAWLCARAVPHQNFIKSTNLSSLLCAMNGTSTDASNSTCDAMLAATKFSPSNAKRFALIYHLFGLLWTNQFIQVLCAPTGDDGGRVWLSPPPQLCVCSRLASW